MNSLTLNVLVDHPEVEFSGLPERYQRFIIEAESEHWEQEPATGSSTSLRKTRTPPYPATGIRMTPDILTDPHSHILPSSGQQYDGT